MKEADIRHLGTLSKIALTDEEVATLTSEIGSILEYVSAIKEIAGETVSEDVGAHYNVFREDVEPHEGGIYTEAVLKNAPERDGSHIVVKKVLKNDE